MGSPVSAVIANLYMKDFEEQALSFAPTAPKIWITLCWRHFYHLNTKWCRKSSTAASQHSRTNHPFYNGDWEWQHNSLFWHMVIKDSEGRLTTSVYRKPTHTSVCQLWLTPLMTLTNDPQSVNAVLSSAYTIDRKISSLNHRLPLRKRRI